MSLRCIHEDLIFIPYRYNPFHNCYQTFFNYFLWSLASAMELEIDSSTIFLKQYLVLTIVIRICQIPQNFQKHI